ncbi:MAG TPA: flagellar hook-length control protein FliK [Roseiarcus sp.]|nr:flagellar hook-length control protein FliK [Roseiarcus sp.]
MSASSVAPHAAAATANAPPAGLMAARAAQHGGAAGQSVFAAVLQELASDAQTPAPESGKSGKDNAPKSGAAKDGAAHDKPHDRPEATGQSVDPAAAIAALVAPQPDAAAGAAAVAALIAPPLPANASAAATTSGAPAAAAPPSSNGTANAAAPRIDMQASAPTPPGSAAQAWAARLQAQGQPTAAAGAPMPSDSTAQLALATAPSLAPPVVDVHVQRARTYLGVDGVTQTAKIDSAALASAGPDAAKSVKPSLPTAAAPAAPLAKANGGEQASDGAMRREGSNDARNGAGDQNSREIPTAAASAPATSDAVLLNSAVAAAPVGLDQLPDLIAKQAENMTAPAAAANASAPAASQNPVKELEVQLNPADLGSLTVKMRLANGNLAVVIETSKDSTAKLIEGERDAIAERLASVEQPVASVVIQASDSVPNQGGDSNGSGSAAPQQGDAQSSAANSSNGQAHSAPRDDRPERQPNPAEDEAPRRARSGDLFV